MKEIKISQRYVRSLIKPRQKDTHKGTYGHVLIIAGSRGMTGAAVLCAGGALRSGAGLVTIAIPVSQQTIVARHVRAEAMTLPLPETKSATLSFSVPGPEGLGMSLPDRLCNPLWLPDVIQSC